MWQGGGRVWGHVAGVGVCGRVSGLWHGWGHVAGVGTYDRAWEHVAGCRGMWQGWWHVAGVGYVVGGQAYDMDVDMWWGGGIWQGGGM